MPATDRPLDSGSFDSKKRRNPGTRWPRRLVVAGLALELASFVEAHPITFSTFLLGAALALTGAGLSLWKLLGPTPAGGGEGARLG